MDDFSQFREFVLSDSKFSGLISDTLNSLALEIDLPAGFGQDNINSLASYIATTSLYVSLLMVQAYHQWLNRHEHDHHSHDHQAHDCQAHGCDCHSHGHHSHNHHSSKG